MGHRCFPSQRVSFRARHPTKSRTPPVLTLVLSIVGHGALLLTLPQGDDLGKIDEDLVPISAELLRAAAPEPGPPTEGSAGAGSPPGPAPEPPPPGGSIVREKAPRRPRRPRDLDGGVAAADGGLAEADGGPPSGQARTRGLAAKLPTNVRLAVLARPALLAGSPHEEMARETIRRAVGMRLRPLEDGGSLDPLASLEEIVVVTANPFEAGNFSAAAAGGEDAAPPGFERRGGQLVRKAVPRPRPVSLEEDPPVGPPPAPRFAWRARLLALADPTDGTPKPVVALVGNDLTSLTFGRLDVPIPPRIELQAYETPEHGAVARASALFDTPEDAAAALTAWREELDSKCRSLLLAAIGLGAPCRRVELLLEGSTVRANLIVEPDEVRAVLAVLQSIMRGRRRGS